MWRGGMLVSEMTLFGLFRTVADFSIVVLEDAFASAVCVARDMLDTAARLAPRVGTPAPVWRVCSLHGGRVRLHGGVELDTLPLPAGGQIDGSVWVLPGLALASPEAVDARLRTDALQQVAQQVRVRVGGGATVAAACSAVFVLHAAGVLEGRRATTTWWLAPHLAALAPRTRVEVERVVCADGPVVTAGTAFSQVDLMLHLLSRYCGPALADLTARVLLVEGKPDQGGFIVPDMLAGGDALIAGLVRRIETALPQCPSVAELAAELGMSPRTLSRHVRALTGRSTLSLVHGVKLRRARQLIESSRLSVEQVAEALGYGDATALRRLMKRKLGASPRQFR